MADFNEIIDQNVWAQKISLTLPSSFVQVTRGFGSPPTFTHVESEFIEKFYQVFKCMITPINIVTLQ